MSPGDLRGPASRLDHRRGGLRVLVADARGRPVSAPGLGRWLARIAPARARGTVTIALVRDAIVRELNRDFRGIDRETDVLSFPSDEVVRRPRLADARPAASRCFGDIFIARGVARRHARAEPVPTLPPAHVGLVGPFHEVEERGNVPRKGRWPGQYR